MMGIGGLDFHSPIGVIANAGAVVPKGLSSRDCPEFASLFEQRRHLGLPH